MFEFSVSSETFHTWLLGRWPEIRWANGSDGWSPLSSYILEQWWVSEDHLSSEYAEYDSGEFDVQYGTNEATIILAEDNTVVATCAIYGLDGFEDAWARRLTADKRLMAGVHTALEVLQSLPHRTE